MSARDITHRDSGTNSRSNSPNSIPMDRYLNKQSTLMLAKRASQNQDLEQVSVGQASTFDLDKGERDESSKKRMQNAKSTAFRNVLTSQSAEGLGRFGKKRRNNRAVAFGTSAIRQMPSDLEPPHYDGESFDINPCNRCMPPS